MFHATRPVLAAYAMGGGPSLEKVLLARHVVIDHLLAEAIERGEIGQVVEVAAGLSPRGYLMSQRFRDRGLVYIEGDLPGMAARKRAIFTESGLESAKNHHIVELNALIDDGADSIGGVCGPLLDPNVGTAVITEGLINYFDTATVEGMWARFARFLGGYPRGVYLSDLHTEGQARAVPGAMLFKRMLAVVARGTVHLHFDDGSGARDALGRAGFADVHTHDPASFSTRVAVPAPVHTRPIYVIEARVS
jgi:O-methyltransferase involved in polyketide biosynthesis